MNAPSSYFEWKAILERFATGDDSTISLMHNGVMIMDAGSAPGYLNIVNQAYVKRKQLWIDKLNSFTSNPRLKSSSDYSVVINQSKVGLRCLMQYCRLSAFSTDIQEMLIQDLNMYVNEVRKSLKDNITRSKVPEMNALLIIFENLDTTKVDIGEFSNVASTTTPPFNGKRRIIH